MNALQYTLDDFEVQLIEKGQRYNLQLDWEQGKSPPS